MSKQRGWKRICYLCGDVENVLYIPGAVAMCLSCESRHDTYNDAPIADQEPEYCPYCGNDELEEVFEDEDDVDDERAIANGVDPDKADWEEIEPYFFGYEKMYCEKCDHVLPYGRRLYWNPVKGKYTEKAPITPQERLAEERKLQEAEGQMRLFEEQSS